MRSCRCVRRRMSEPSREAAPRASIEARRRAERLWFERPGGGACRHHSARSFSARGSGSGQSDAPAFPSGARTDDSKNFRCEGGRSGPHIRLRRAKVRRVPVPAWLHRAVARAIGIVLICIHFALPDDPSEALRLPRGRCHAGPYNRFRLTAGIVRFSRRRTNVEGGSFRRSHNPPCTQLRLRRAQCRCLPRTAGRAGLDRCRPVLAILCHDRSLPVVA